MKDCVESAFFRNGYRDFINTSKHNLTHDELGEWLCILFIFSIPAVKSFVLDFEQDYREHAMDTTLWLNQIS